MSPAMRSDARREMAATIIGILGLLAFVLLASAGCASEEATGTVLASVVVIAIAIGMLLAVRLIRASDDSPWDDDDEAGA